jgi:hypothetical protein
MTDGWADVVGVAVDVSGNGDELDSAAGLATTPEPVR